MHTRVPILATALLAVGTMAATAARADGVYVTITGAHQGRFHGLAQYQNRILGLTFTDNTTTAAGAGSSGTAGHTSMSSYKLTAEWGSAWPQIEQAIASDEVLDVKLEFFGANASQIVYTIDAKNAGLKSLTLDFDASASPMATYAIEVVSRNVEIDDGTATATAGGSAPAGGATLRANRPAPVVTLAQSRAMIRSVISANDPPSITEAYLTIPNNSSFHSEVAGPPARTAQLRTFELQITQPITPNGTTSGHHQNLPIDVTKALGTASSDFAQALQHSQQLSSVVIEFVSHPAGGASRVIYQATLTNAVVSKDQTTMTGGSASENINLRFQHITTSDNVGHTSAQDDWQN